jgi:hypothetical protein
LAAGIAALSRDAASEVQPRFGDEEKTRFVAVCRPFCQIKARGGQSPVLEFQTHFRAQSTSWRGLEKSQLSSQNITERPRFHARGHHQLNRARKILSIHELIANLNLRPKEKAATVGGLSASIDTSPTQDLPLIGLTYAALNGPAGPAAVPGSATTVIVVIAVMMAPVPIRGGWSRGADCDGADKA